jgi:hypothetical protein
MSQGYNGWSNRETWLVNVWFDPTCREDVEAARYALEEAVDQLPDFLRDFVSVDQVNWDELSEHFSDDEPDCDDSDDGYALASAGYGTDEDYGYAGDEY